MEFEEFVTEGGGKPFNIRQRCFYFSRTVLEFVKTATFDMVFASVFDQLVRATTSIGANVIEGKAGINKNDWLKYLGVALKSANETKYWLCLIRDTFECNKEEINQMVAEADEISKIIASIIINANK